MPVHKLLVNPCDLLDGGLRMVSGIGGSVDDLDGVAGLWILVGVFAGVVDGGVFGASILQFTLLLLRDSIAGLEAEAKIGLEISNVGSAFLITFCMFTSS